MIEVVIIGHNEGAHVERMLESLPASWRKVYVADRCTDGTVEKLLTRDDTLVVDTTPMKLEGRQTSFCRNLGLSHCSATSDILFLDGDRYPVEGDLEEAYETMRTDVLCLPLREDFRHPDDFDLNYGRVLSGFYSCGLLMRRKAIVAARDFQCGRLFDESLQSTWGIEDTALGDVCFHLGLTAALSDKVRLRGGFDKTLLDSLDAIERRLRFREHLDVRWD